MNVTVPANTWIVIPAYNEATALGRVVAPLLEMGYSVVVVDDGSTDQTTKVAETTGANLCQHKVNLGQGAALRTGIGFALQQGAHFLITFDADGQHSVSDIPNLVAPIQAGSADVALGSRFLESGHALEIPRSRLALLKMAVIFTRLSTGLQVTDAHCGIRAFSAEAGRKVRITENGMAHADQILRQIVEQGLRWIEVPVTVIYTPYSLAKGQRLSGLLRENLVAAFRIQPR